jgi:hypothetical protein
VKEKSKTMGPEVPDRIYVYGQDELPDNRMEEDEQVKKEFDEDVWLFASGELFRHLLG